MQTIEEEFESLKEEVAKAKEAYDRAQGERVALMKEIKKMWGCSTIEEAKALLKKKRITRQKALDKFKENYIAYKKDWYESD